MRYVVALLMVLFVCAPAEAGVMSKLKSASVKTLRVLGGAATGFSQGSANYYAHLPQPAPYINQTTYVAPPPPPTIQSNIHSYSVTRFGNTTNVFQYY